MIDAYCHACWILVGGQNTMLAEFFRRRVFVASFLAGDKLVMSVLFCNHAI